MVNRKLDIRKDLCYTIYVRFNKEYLIMTLLKKERVIFDSEPNYDDAKQYLIERRLEDGEPTDNITDEEIYDEANFEVEMNFGDEVESLKVEINYEDVNIVLPNAVLVD